MVNTTGTYEIFDMLTDYRTIGMGVNCDKIPLRWKVRPIDACHSGAKQQAFQIVITDDTGAIMWDSGKTKSSEFQTVCQTPLQSHTTYHWKVRIWDDLDVRSEWSAAQSFTTGLRDGDWLGSWITYDGIDSIYPFRDHVWIRKKFHLSSVPKDALLYIATLGFHDLYINGVKASDIVLAPGRSSNRDGRVVAYYVTYDISRLLVAGENVIGIAMEAGFTRFNINLVPALRVQLYGTDLELHSNNTWKCIANGNQYLGGFRWGDFGGEKTITPAAETAWSTAAYNDNQWESINEFHVDCQIREWQAEPDKIIEILEPVSIRMEKDSCLVDMGQNFTGWFALSLPRLTSDVIIEVSDKANVRNAFHQRITYAPGLPHGGWYCSHFNFVSGRYFTISGLSNELTKEDIRGYVLSNTMERCGQFRCDDALLNQIFETDLRTYRANVLSGVVMDCPHRERLGYGDTAFNSTWGDGLLNHAGGAFYKNFLKMWADTQMEDGYFAHTAPDHNGGGGTTFSSYPVTGSLEFYNFYQDRSFLEEMYPSLKKWAEYLHRHTKAGLLTKYECDLWDFLGDWATPDSDDWGQSETALYFNNCSYAYILKLMGEIAGILGVKDDKRMFSARHRRLSANIRAKYQTNEGYFCLKHAKYQAVALEAGVVSREDIPTVYDFMLQIVRKKGYLDGGSVGMPYLQKQLERTEEGKALLYAWMTRQTVPSYGAFVVAGETTWPEMWDMRNIYGASRIHSTYTGCARWIVEQLGGVKIHRDSIVISPFIPENMEFAEYKTQSALGPVSCKWKKENNTIVFHVDIPFSAKATFTFRGRHQQLYPGHHRITVEV